VRMWSRWKALVAKTLRRPHIGHAIMEQPYKPPQTDDAEAKTRNCLVCKSAFVSAWAGERICRRCKSTEKWRAGLA
jgi:hypothetical protein